jgi:non-canonical purine NTP pyrophosphatase (RdgB/HAM1 family)
VLERGAAVQALGRPRDFRLVFTNGCFDVLHRGHVESLAAARALGDRLVVGLNSDASVRRLKGPGRPLVPAEDRARILASLRPVDAVVVFEEDTPEALVRELLPDVLVKGADYDGEKIAGAEAVREAGGQVRLLPLLPGRSTSALVRRMAARGVGLAGGAGTRRPEPPDRLLVATRNPHKLDEMRELLGEVPTELVSLQDVGAEPLEEEADLETADSFAGNALAKALHFHARTGMTTLGEDSGLCVDALGAGPGVRTRRFAPDEWARRYGRDAANNRWLLERLRGVPPAERGACYRCAAAVVDGIGRLVVEGEVCGRIAESLRGEGGFGYDPLFLLPERGHTFGELPREVKQATSHRARAMARLRPWLLGGEPR